MRRDPVDLIHSVQDRPWRAEADPPNSFNCGEFIRWAYREAWGIDAPAILACADSLRQVVRDVGDLERYGLVRTDPPPRLMDVVKVVRGRTGTEHIGLWLPGDGGLVVHWERGAGCVMERRFDIEATGRRLEFFRHPEAPTW